MKNSKKIKENKKVLPVEFIQPEQEYYESILTQPSPAVQGMTCGEYQAQYDDIPLCRKLGMSVFMQKTLQQLQNGPCCGIQHSSSELGLATIMFQPHELNG